MVIAPKPFGRPRRTAVRRSAHPLKMEPDLALRLHCFCEAHFGAAKNRVICEAIDRLIDAELETDPVAKGRFELAMARERDTQRADGPGPVRIVRTKQALDSE